MLNSLDFFALWVTLRESAAGDGRADHLNTRNLSTLDVATVALAAFRITRLITRDDLPPVKAARQRIMAWAGDGSTLAEGLECPWCAGFWVSLATTALALRFPRVRTALLPWAVSGAVGLLASADSAMGKESAGTVTIEIDSTRQAESAPAPSI